MSRRIVLSSLAAVVVLGGAGAFALAQAQDQPIALHNSTARYTAPHAGRNGSLVFTTDVTTSAGVKSLKVLAWPASNPTLAKHPLTKKDMAEVESATCKTIGDDTARCTYKAAVTTADAASQHGIWHIATLATGRDGDTVFNAKTSDFTVG